VGAEGEGTEAFVCKDERIETSVQEW